MTDKNENDGQLSGQPQNGQQGLYIRGTYLGVQPARTFKRSGSDEVVNVRPKVGLSVNGEEVAIAAKDDEHLSRARSGWVKGDEVTIHVEASPPFGARGSVRYALPGVREDRGESWQ